MLGKKGKDPLVAICMNPSTANLRETDPTTQKVISVSKKLGKDGWVIFNIYPGRATDVEQLQYNDKVAQINIDKIEAFLISHHIKQVWGAWGDLKYIGLQKGRDDLLTMLNNHDIEVFYFGTLTEQGNPRHAIQYQESWNINVENENLFKLTIHNR